MTALGQDLRDEALKFLDGKTIAGRVHRIDLPTLRARLAHIREGNPHAASEDCVTLGLMEVAAAFDEDDARRELRRILAAPAPDTIPDGPTDPSRGWICPRCLTIHGPHVRSCACVAGGVGQVTAPA